MSDENNAGTAGADGNLPEDRAAHDDAAEAGVSGGGEESRESLGQDQGAEDEESEGEGSGQEDGSHRDKTISKLTRNWRATERDRDYWKSVALRNQHSTAPPTVTEADAGRTDGKTEDGQIKTLADFEYDEARYQAYLASVVEQRAVRAAQAELRKEQMLRQMTQVRQAYKARESEFASTSGVEDYEATVYNPSLPITDAMAQVIQESENGPALAYYLGKNPDIAQVIAQLPPLSAARELGRLEGRLAAQRASAPDRKVSKAPPPPAKIEGSGSPGTSIKVDSPDSDKLSDAEWMRRRNAQLQRQRMSNRGH